MAEFGRSANCKPDFVIVRHSHRSPVKPVVQARAKFSNRPIHAAESRRDRKAPRGICQACRPTASGHALRMAMPRCTGQPPGKPHRKTRPRWRDKWRGLPFRPAWCWRRRDATAIILEQLAGQAGMAGPAAGTLGGDLGTCRGAPNCTRDRLPGRCPRDLCR